jgi:hypothetical protein
MNVVFGARSRGEDEGRVSEGQANHLAAYDFSLDVDAGAVYIRLYRAFYHEYTPSLLFRNPWDGNWGLSLRRAGEPAWIEALVWEHLRMTRHNAKFSQGQERGADRYYHHGRYADGWTYRGRTLGNPLMRPNPAAPGMVNTIVVAHHVGLAGSLPAELTYRGLGTYSRNYGAQGVCGNPDCSRRIDGRTPRRDQWSFLADLRVPIPRYPGLTARLGAALDTGELYERRFGLEVGLTWRSR